jgi:hypothetical protein
VIRFLKSARGTGGWVTLTSTAVGFATALVTYTVTITLSYANVVKDIAVIRSLLEERSTVAANEHRSLQAQIDKITERLAEVSDELARLEAVHPQIGRRSIEERPGNTRRSEGETGVANLPVSQPLPDRPAIPRRVAALRRAVRIRDRHADP